MRYMNKDFARQSLELHLFFARIMKEHSFFLQISFTPRDMKYTKQADEFRQEFDHLLHEVVLISDGVVSPEVLDSGEVFTGYTVDAEMASSFYTGVQIPIEITKAEMELVGGKNMVMNQSIDQRVYDLNQRAIELISKLIQFKMTILANVLSCKMFTGNYPHLIEHILREARMYLKMVNKLQAGEKLNLMNEELQQEMFWNNIMAEHAKFIRGLLDPTEKDLITTAHKYANMFDRLTDEAKSEMNHKETIEKLTADSLDATKGIRDFKAQGTQGLIDCKIKSIIIPLLADHTLREANHYLRLLKQFSK